MTIKGGVPRGGRGTFPKGSGKGGSTSLAGGAPCTEMRAGTTQVTVEEDDGTSLS